MIKTRARLQVMGYIVFTIPMIHRIWLWYLLSPKFKRHVFFFFFFSINVNNVTYVACPKSYSERIAGTNNSYSCRIIGHSGTYFTVQNDTHFNDLTATVTLVTISGHDRSKSNYAKCFRNFYFSQPA